MLKHGLLVEEPKAGFYINHVLFLLQISFYYRNNFSSRDNHLHDHPMGRLVSLLVVLK
jgi:hypothetical protein